MNNNLNEENTNVVDPHQEVKKEGSSSNGKDYADKTIETVEKIVNTKDMTKEFDKEQVAKFKVSAIISYLSILFLIPIVKSEHKRSSYVLFHVNQGLALTILQLIVWFITSILSSIFRDNYALVSQVPGWVTLINTILGAGVLAIFIFGLVNTINGKSKELPIIGKYKLIK